jgi:tetratricopeptide (TPR) repeat protein
VKEHISSIIAEALALCDDENPSEASELLLQALLDYPEDVNLLTTMGIVQSKLDLEDEAESTFRKVLGIESHNEIALCALGRLLDSELRSDEAQELLRNFLREQPQSHCAVDDLCRILYSDGRVQESLEIAQKHAFHYPKEVDAYSAVRYILARIEDSLCFDYEGSEDNPEHIEELFSVFAKQFEMILRMEKEIGVEALGERGILSDLQEDTIRLTGELEHLMERAKGIAWQEKESMMQRIRPLLEIGIERRMTSASET